MTWKAMLLICLTASAVHADDTIIPLAQKDWKHFNANSETVEGALRVRIPIGRYISGETQEHYLQIRLGNMESAAAAPFCSNTSTNGGGIGALYSGLNTFKMPPHAAGRRFFLLLGMSGDRKEKFGPWVDFQEIRTTENPMNAPVVTLEKGDVVKVGSKLNITLRTAEILKEAPSVRFCLTPLRTFSISPRPPSSRRSGRSCAVSTSPRFSSPRSRTRWHSPRSRSLPTTTRQFRPRRAIPACWRSKACGSACRTATC